MAGTVVNPKRPRYQANERFDTADADVQSRAPREQDKASMRAVHSEPRNIAGNPSTIGMIFTGFELTLNPTSGTDGKVRVSANLGVAVDSDGGVLIKPQGVTFDITVPTGTYQLYAYYSEISTDNAKRRFLSVTSPFSESTNSMDTTFQGQCLFTAIAGNAASVVAEAVVNGVTTPLCCIGIATNGGTGAITMTGYDAVNAPNGTDIANRLSVPELASSPPASPFVNGSLSTVTEMLKHLMYTVGQLAWKGSNQTPPTFANNRGAYTFPLVGIDPAYRNLPGYVTIGNGTTAFGDFDTTSFANAKLLLDAAYAALPANGGYIYIKQGTTLSGFDGVTSPIPAGKRVTFVGVGNGSTGSPQITLAANESFTAGVNSQVVFTNLVISWVGNAFIADTSASNVSSVNFVDCTFVKPSGTDTGAAISASGGSVVNDITMLRCKASITLTAGSANGMLMRLSQVARRVTVRDVNITVGNKECSIFSFTDMRDNVVFENVFVDDPGATTTTATAGVGVVVANSTVNSETEGARRFFKNIVSRCAGVPLLFLGSAGYITMETCTYAPPGNTPAIVATAYTGSGPLLFSGGRVTFFSIVGPIPSITMRELTFLQAGTVLGVNNGATGSVVIQRCNFTPAGTGSPVTVNHTTLTEIEVSDCRFDGVNNPASSSFACVDCAGAGTGTTDTVTRALIRRNTITNFQNIVSSGATGAHRMFRVRCTFPRQIICTDNVAFNIARGSSGTSRFGPFLLEVTTVNSGASGLIADEIMVCNNVLGNVDPADSFNDDCLGLIRVGDFSTIRNLTIKNNFIRQAWMSDVATINLLTPNTIELFSTFPSPYTLEHLQVEGNTMYMEGQNAGGGSMNNMDTEFFHSTGTSSIVQANTWSFQDNQLVYGVTVSGNMSFNGTTAFGMRFNNGAGGQPLALVIKHNVVTLKGAAVGATAFRIQLNPGLSSLPAVPASGGSWADNIGLVRV